VSTTLVPGVASALSPLVRRVLAPNPNHMTGPGTNTYLVGVDEVAVIDPGPDDRGHVDAIVGAAGAERIRWILLTHTHPDHWPAATRLALRTGAPVLAFPTREPGLRLDGRLRDGDAVVGSEFRLEALHTPGHAPNHLCFRLEEERVLFTGDNVLDGMWSVISPERGGDMAEYLHSLERMRRLRTAWLAPGHGDRIDDARVRIDEYLAHRRDRERQVLRALRREPATVTQLVARLYPDLDAPLVPVAARQVHAHLLKLRTEGRVTGRSVRARWAVA
jgi:glyoxylase-like metal-dependent hydrolase (beta-lactamase superfamily II)